MQYTKIQPLAFRINEACAALGIGRTSIYELIAAKKLKPIKIAGRVLILRSEIDRLLADAQAAS